MYDCITPDEHDACYQCEDHISGSFTIGTGDHGERATFCSEYCQTVYKLTHKSWTRKSWTEWVAKTLKADKMEKWVGLEIIGCFEVAYTTTNREYGGPEEGGWHYYSRHKCFGIKVQWDQVEAAVVHVEGLGKLIANTFGGEESGSIVISYNVADETDRPHYE